MQNYKTRKEETCHTDQDGTVYPGKQGFQEGFRAGVGRTRLTPFYSPVQGNKWLMKAFCE